MTMSTNQKSFFLAHKPIEMAFRNTPVETNHEVLSKTSMSYLVTIAQNIDVLLKNNDT